MFMRARGKKLAWGPEIYVWVCLVFKVCLVFNKAAWFGLLVCRLRTLTTSASNAVFLDQEIWLGLLFIWS